MKLVRKDHRDHTMAKEPNLSIHDDVKFKIENECNELGFTAKSEYSGKGWRADVFAEKDDAKFAFEVQITPQSLVKTIARQEKYKRDGIVCCWLFEKTPSKLTDERPDLPLFQILKEGDSYNISLNDRKILPIEIFLDDFLNGKMSFRKQAVVSKTQNVKIQFYEMGCWNCGVINHLYFVDSEFRSTCNAKIYYSETLWGSDRVVYLPEITRLVADYAKSNTKINLAVIKERMSKTVGHSYKSFGCADCDSIFGDWFIHEAEIEVRYGDGVIDTIETNIEIDMKLSRDIPHWCHPGELDFCSENVEQIKGVRKQ